MIIRIFFYELVSGSYYCGDMVPPAVDRNSNVVVHTILALEIGYKNKYTVYHTIVYNVYSGDNKSSIIVHNSSPSLAFCHP